MPIFQVINTAENTDNFYQGMVKDAANWATLEALVPVGTTGTQTLSNKTLVFSATQVPSANPNALDDYEEGTFTATMTVATGSISLNAAANTLQYTKIGRQVTITGGLLISAVSSPTGTCTIDGLPFAAGGLSAFSVSITNSQSAIPCGTIQGASTAITLHDNAAVNGVFGGLALAGKLITIGGTYITS